MATRWLNKILEYEGIKETPGKGTHPKIAEWYILVGLEGADDSKVPWCAVCINGVLHESGIVGTGTASSQDFLDWGDDIEEAEIGAIAIFRGHVAIVAALEPELMIVGGNQSDGILIQPARYYGEPIGFRWPNQEITKWPGDPPLVATEDAPELEPGANISIGPTNERTGIEANLSDAVEMICVRICEKIKVAQEEILAEQRELHNQLVEHLSKDTQNGDADVPERYKPPQTKRAKRLLLF